jgi:hypothetical protein
MGSTAETRAGETAFDVFVGRYLVRLKRADRPMALAALKALALEAQAIERRRLCTDSTYFAAAVALTRAEIARHGQDEPRSSEAVRSPRIASHLASRARATRSRAS